MKVVVVGAGAVGGYFGSRLAEAGVDVTFLVREKRAAQLRERGLTVRSVQGDYRYTPQVVTDAAEVEACDVLVVAVKNYHLSDTLSMLKPLVERGATSSMHQDFRKGLPLEVESLQGVAVRYADEEGIDLPTVRTLYGLLVPHATPVA